MNSVGNRCCFLFTRHVIFFHGPSSADFAGDKPVEFSSQKYYTENNQSIFLASSLYNICVIKKLLIICRQILMAMITLKNIERYDGSLRPANSLHPLVVVTRHTCFRQQTYCFERENLSAKVERHSLEAYTSEQASIKATDRLYTPPYSADIDTSS